MTLSPHEFIRRFLMHVLPKGFHRIRHYGLFANGNRTANIARARELLGAVPRVAGPEEKKAATPDEPRGLPCPCGLRCATLGTLPVRATASWLRRLDVRADGTMKSWSRCCALIR